MNEREKMIDLDYRKSKTIADLFDKVVRDVYDGTEEGDYEFIFEIIKISKQVAIERGWINWWIE